MEKEVRGTIIFGLDVGVTRFGVVAIDDLRAPPLAWATFHSRGKDYSDKPTYHRAVQLSNQVVTWVKSRTVGYRHVVIVAERPIYNNNARSFEIQWRLFQQVLSDLRHIAGPDWFLEIAPSSAKYCLAGKGNASKLDMICASHFDGPDYDKEDAETLADAEGIANCWYTTHTEAYSPMSKEEACFKGAIISGEAT